MGKVSYTFSCGWENPTFSQGDILWKQKNDVWTPYKIKTILIDYSCGNEGSYAVFRCNEIEISTEHPYYIAEGYNHEYSSMSILVGEYEIGMNVFSRNPDEPLEEYKKRKLSKQM